MRKLTATRSIALLLVSLLTLTSCAGGLFTGDAKHDALQALVTTTRSCILTMTAAGIAYDMGAFGKPGSKSAEDAWQKISAESIKMNRALNAWSDAVKTNKDSSAYMAIVSEALAVIAALLPSRIIGSMTGPEWLDGRTLDVGIAMLQRSESFRSSTHVIEGGF